ncbi:MAG TPA: EAL domain-containing response regulator [Burkholderiales bacterium]|nr:EAL domain-containing response regulator [Burkholderiales bacterium]
MELQSLRVMVVEDQPIQRQIALRMLESMGLKQVLEADNGQSALTRLTELNEPLDIIICDLHMPGMDGVEFIRHLGSRQLVSSLILASGMEPALVGSVEAMARVQGLQVLGALQKPLNYERLQEMLTKYIPHAQSAKAAAREALTYEALQDGIRDRRIVAYFQPKIRVSDGAFAGAEALARWDHPQYGIVEPAAFIPCAEQSELIEPLTWIMVERTMEQSVIWHQAGHRWPLSVNLSLNHLEQATVADRIAAMAEDYGIPPEDIVLEVTESLAAINLAPVLGNLARLRMKGFGVAIDDYGTGYSSLAQLSRIPFTELKIDRSFVNGAASRTTLRAILGSSIELARQLKLDSVAEGVETQADLYLLKELGCDLAQGYLVAEPMPAAALEEWITKRMR